MGTNTQLNFISNVIDPAELQASTNSLMKPNEPDLEKNYPTMSHQFAHIDTDEGARQLSRYLLYVTMVKGLEAAIAEANKLPEHEPKVR